MDCARERPCQNKEKVKMSSPLKGTEFLEFDKTVKTYHELKNNRYLVTFTNGRHAFYKYNEKKKTLVKEK